MLPPGNPEILWYNPIKEIAIFKCINTGGDALCVILTRQ